MIIFIIFSQFFTKKKWLKLWENDFIRQLGSIANGLGNANMLTYLWQQHVQVYQSYSVFDFQRACIEYVIICYFFGIMTPTINYFDHILRKNWQDTNNYHSSMDRSGTFWVYSALLQVSMHYFYENYFLGLEISFLPKGVAIFNIDSFQLWIMTSFWIYVSSMETISSMKHPQPVKL